MRRPVFALALALAASPLVAQSLEGPLPELDGRQTRHTSVLNNEAVIKMSKAGLDDGIILQTIRSQTGDYRTGPEDLVALKDAGVSQTIISALLAKNSGMQVREEKPVEVTPISPNTDDPGAYYKNTQGQWEAVGPELVNYRDGGALKSLVTNNIIKKDLNGIVSGPKSRLTLRPGTEVLILAPSTQVDAVEYIVLRFQQKGDRREFRVKTGNVFHSETGTDRDALDIPIRKIGSKLFGFTIPADLKKGEYGVLAPGSAGAPGIAHAGKIYTFSISE